MKQLEIERKFDIAEGAALPALGDVVQLGQARQHRMRAVYLDTVDLLLIRHRITLRRREGGSDEGWHLKLPRGLARLEVHAPLGDGAGRTRVPDGHVEAASAALPETLPEGPDGALVPVAVLRTLRTEIDLLDDEGHVVAQLCDDVVTALPRGVTWRELEVELVGPDATDVALLDRISEVLQAQGLEVSSSPSKLSRALGDRPERIEAWLGSARAGSAGLGSAGAGRTGLGSARPGSAGAGTARLGPAGQSRVLTGKDGAGEVVQAYLLEQLSVILGREADLRVDAPGAVHRSRVAVRRTRSALRTFRRLLDREVTDPLRAELRWWGEVLGGPRDAEVMLARVGEELAGVPADLVRGPVVARVETDLGRQHAAAHAALVEQLGSERYLALVDALVDLVADPPWRGRARRRADRVLPALVEEAVDRAVEDRAAAAGLEGDARLHQLHEVRKRAKAVRYGWEALAPLGDEAQEAAEAWEQVTEQLGGMQDAVVAVEHLRELLDAAEDAGEPSLTYGVLIGRELDAEERAADAGEQAMDVALI